MPTITQTYDASTKQFEDGSDHFFVSGSSTNDMYTTIITTGLVGATETITFSQGNGVENINEVVAITTKVIALGDSVVDTDITTFKGDYGAIKMSGSATTSGTIKIIVNNGN